MKPVIAKLRFLSREEGGRRTPAGPRYATVARFPDADNECWSIVATIRDVPDAEGRVSAEIELLMPEAPSNLLHPGASFVLLEGAREVATGEVVTAGPQSAQTVSSRVGRASLVATLIAWMEQPHLGEPDYEPDAILGRLA